MLLSEFFVAAFLQQQGELLRSEPSPVPLDIPQLVVEAQRGQRDAVAALYQAHVHRIYRYLYLRVPTTEDAEDLTAEVFLRMVELLPTYRVTGAPFEAWLYRIAAAKVADFYRARKRQPTHLLPEEVEDAEFALDDALEPDEFLPPLRRALAQLPQEQQDILVLRFVERKSHEEVAELLGKSVSAVKSTQHRALTRLTALLNQQGKIRHYLRGVSA
jgi:RNA polymerase sigma-70 factor, ECF subfamily